MILNSLFFFATLFMGLNNILPLFSLIKGDEKPAALVKEDLQYRVAFDLGSGNLKMQASWIHPKKNRIVKVAVVESINLPVREAIDRDPNGEIPEEMVQQLKAALLEMQEKAKSHGNVTAYVAGATAAYRSAGNGNEVLERLSKELGVSMFLLSQDEEAMLGFSSLEAEGFLPDDASVIVWENGGGSTQISHLANGKFEAYNLPVGKVAMKTDIIQEIQKKEAATTPNPIGENEAVQAIKWARAQFQNAPDWVKQKTVLGIGAMFPNAVKGIGKSTFTKDDLRCLIDTRLNKTDEELSPDPDPNTPYLLSDLLFLYGVMEELGLQEVDCPKLQGPGSTSGLLIDPSRWTGS